MKKITVLLAAGVLALTATVASAQPVARASQLECFLFPLFAYGCPQAERVVASIIWGTAIGAGVGGVIGASAATLSATNSAWVGAGVGAGVGAVAPVVYR